MQEHRLTPLTLFLSTPSVGRATRNRPERLLPQNNFYPRPPWGGRRPKIMAGLVAQVEHFYPRPPWGGRPAVGAQDVHPPPISIHALRGEGDQPPQYTSPESK